MRGGPETLLQRMRDAESLVRLAGSTVLGIEGQRTVQLRLLAGFGVAKGEEMG